MVTETMLAVQALADEKMYSLHELWQERDAYETSEAFDAAVDQLENHWADTIDGFEVDVRWNPAGDYSRGEVVESTIPHRVTTYEVACEYCENAGRECDCPF